MLHIPSPPEALALLTRWGEDTPQVRAMLLTSTFAHPAAPTDLLSDYDVVLALTDVRPFAESRQWLEAFGKVLVMYQDPLETGATGLHSGNVTQFEGGFKIDFTLVETQYFTSLRDSPQLPAEYDAGYIVLLDKDGLTAGMQPPTYRAYIPSPPTYTQYWDMVEGALLDAVYVAKYLRRGDWMAAWHVMTTYLKDEHLRPLLEWHYETDHGWQVQPRPYGRGMQTYLRPDLYAELQATYAGHDLDEGWQSLFRTLDLLRKVSIELADRLGFPYPQEMVDKSIAYIQEIKEMDLG